MKCQQDKNLKNSTVLKSFFNRDWTILYIVIFIYVVLFFSIYIYMYLVYIYFFSDFYVLFSLYLFLSSLLFCFIEVFFEILLVSHLIEHKKSIKIFVEGVFFLFLFLFFFFFFDVFVSQFERTFLRIYNTNVTKMYYY